MVDKLVSGLTTIVLCVVMQWCCCVSIGNCSTASAKDCAGGIDPLLRKSKLAKSTVPTHTLVKLVREQGSDFAYGFTLELSAVPDDPNKALSAILEEFGRLLKEEYADSFPGGNKVALIVDYSDVGMSGNDIKGRAAILTIAPVSLSYDANLRRGKISVRFSPGQRKEAEAWAKKNIETLARDKNIALTTGQLPPKANCLPLGEKVEGNVMEIEFKTE